MMTNLLNIMPRRAVALKRAAPSTSTLGRRRLALCSKTTHMPCLFGWFSTVSLSTKSASRLMSTSTSERAGGDEQGRAATIRDLNLSGVELAKYELIMNMKEAASYRNFEAMMKLWTDFETSQSGQELPRAVLPIMLSVCHKAEHLDTVTRIIKYMQDMGMEMTEPQLVCLVRCYADAHDTDKALAVVRNLVKKGKGQAKLRTYQPITSSFAARGQIENLFDLVDEIIIENKLEINERLLQTVLRGWALSDGRGDPALQARLDAFIEFTRDVQRVFGIDLPRMNQVRYTFDHKVFHSPDSPEQLNTPSILIDHKSAAGGQIIAENDSTLVTVKFVDTNDTMPGIFWNPRINVGGMDDDDNDGPVATRRVTYRLRQGTEPEHLPLQMVAVSPSTCLCPNCGRKLQQAKITQEERKLLNDALTVAVAEGDYDKASSKMKPAKVEERKQSRIKDFEMFKRWLSSNGKYTHVVDGANVAYSAQNNRVEGGFQYQQIMAVVMKIEQEYPDARILVILPQVYTRNVIPNNVSKSKGTPNNNINNSGKRGITYLSVRDREILADLKNRKMLYSVPPYANDDWYWIHMAIASEDTIIVTNDKMRDHCFNFMDQRPLWRLRSSQVYGFMFEYVPPSREGNETIEEVCERAKLRSPAPFSRELQRQGDRLHVPASDDDNIWMCLKPY